MHQEKIEIVSDQKRVQLSPYGALILKNKLLLVIKMMLQMRGVICIYIQFKCRGYEWDFNHLGI